MRVDDFITEQERKEYCDSCYELCGRTCVIYRKASQRYDKMNNAFSTNQKEFAHEITKKFSFEELALFMYDNSCEYCQKQHDCMGHTTIQDCVENIRQKFEKSYFET